jgi:hypothetical protein
MNKKKFYGKDIEETIHSADPYLLSRSQKIHHFCRKVHLTIWTLIWVSPSLKIIRPFLERYLVDIAILLLMLVFGIICIYLEGKLWAKYDLENKQRKWFKLEKPEPKKRFIVSTCLKCNGKGKPTSEKGDGVRRGFQCESCLATWNKRYKW